MTISQRHEPAGTYRWRAVSFVLTFGAILAMLSVGAASGLAAASTQQQGSQLLQSLETGEQKCQQLSDAQFEVIGEYVMGRMLGSTARHEAMDEQMRDATDAASEAQAHVFMGRRFANCVTGDVPDVFGSMMGMMGNYSGANPMGWGNGRDGNGFGSGMMGSSGWSDGDANEQDGFDGAHMGDTWGWLIIVVMVILMGGMGWMMWSMNRGAGDNRRSSSNDPIELLKIRYARGDVTTEEFQERRQAIEDAGT